MPFNYGGCNKEELGGSFDVFPEGKYEFFIESITETYTRRNNPVVEIVLKPMDYQLQKHGKVWHRIILDNEWTRVNIGRFLASIGEDPEQECEIFFNRYKGEKLTAKIKHNKKDGEVFVNAQLLPRTGEKAASAPLKETREKVRGHEYTPASSLANEWDGESGIEDDDIPF